jgi:ribonuclease III
MNMNEESNVKVIVNPYNFNNKLYTQKDLTKLLNTYGITSQNNGFELYQQSFIHKSYSKKNPYDIGEDVVIANKPEGAIELFDYDYERLEFLGDSVVGLAITRYLYERFSTENEGFLTQMRTKLVNGEMLGYLSKQIGFSEFIIISRHVEDKCDGRNSQHILEDVFEAFIGAMFLDFNQVDNYNLLDNFYSGIGFQICEKFIINLIEDIIDFSDLILKNTNYKDQISRFFMNNFEIKPVYSEPRIEGGLSDRIFIVDVLDKTGKVISSGKGKSKKKAEQSASKNALIYYKVIS